MLVDHVPLLSRQRELMAMPRTPARFQAYLRTMIRTDGKSLRFPPLVAMNPMGREHVAQRLDALEAIGAEQVAERAVVEVLPEVRDAEGIYRLGLVVIDDLKGGWTNRYDLEDALRFGRPTAAGAGWLGVPIWASEEPTAAAVRLACRAIVLRAAWHAGRARPVTLRERMEQEGRVLAVAGYEEPVLDADDLEYTRAVIGPLLDAEDRRTSIECLFGDVAARSLGFTPRGLSLWAGLALALHDARVPVGF